MDENNNKVKEVTFSRTFPVPASRVWKAWTDPHEVTQWWGPDNVTIPACEIDLRMGGRIYIVMEAGEAMGQYKGTRWPMEATITALDPNVKLAYHARAWTEGAEATTEIDQETELTLAEENGATKMEVRAAILSTGPDAGMAVQGMEYGFNQQFDKLAKFLGK